MRDLLNKDEVEIAEFCQEVLDLEKAKLPDEYYYTSVPLCVIESVFSIGVRYEGVKNTVKRYCEYFGLHPYRLEPDYPTPSEQQSVEHFLRSFDELGLEEFVHTVFKNRQRTSTRNGILKTEAVHRFCKVLNKYGVNYLQDVKKLYGNEQFEEEIKSIPGQKSGISLIYFYMLAGEDNWIKPDRMIIRFLERVLQRKVKMDEAQTLLQATSKILAEKYPNMTPRLLDYQIWNYVRNNNL
ncbi:hypothetical protein QQ991_01745 [Weizmannia coagulans]|uniref:Uncharacterized protein n=2 Tax=Heyndrickxia TaxID=2837504 RepID=A0AAN0WA88_HEYCO|nr:MULTISPECIES: hypothetical protein [Heyndrickxia]AJO20851.1 hypothetical protein SB48_HM08orf00083 [Heyndrickxia coagulans]AKN53491.1 hypothetical protein AB434_1086 [Heyndrickxia coagulans]ATW81575.1 hypothetical protein CIW84_00275 [Heyndrickxia coagulans]KGB28082.1 hypothetical protein IE89_19140 [Heyndrickxia coagulans]KXT19954.1 hypothetical protein UZ35_12350 [Heyndrickxia coagulans]